MEDSDLNSELGELNRHYRYKYYMYRNCKKKNFDPTLNKNLGISSWDEFQMPTINTRQSIAT